VKSLPLSVLSVQFELFVSSASNVVFINSKICFLSSLLNKNLNLTRNAPTRNIAGGTNSIHKALDIFVSPEKELEIKVEIITAYIRVKPPNQKAKNIFPKV